MSISVPWSTLISKMAALPGELSAGTCTWTLAPSTGIAKPCACFQISRPSMNWQAELAHERFEPLSRAASGASRRMALVAAHPDDESIGASALLARCPNACVIFVTDGAPQDRKLWPKAIEGSRQQYAAIRRQEAERALAHAGIPARQISWLGGVDQEAIFTVAQLLARLVHLVEQVRPESLVTHPYEGGHPDHDCTALLASLALSLIPMRLPITLATGDW